MSFPGPTRGRGSDQGNGGVVMSAGRGAVLVVLAILVGILVLATLDNGSTGTATPVTETTEPTVPVTNPDGTVVTTPPATALDGTPITTTKKKKTTTTTAAAVKGARPNDQVVVQVLNGSGIQNAATTRSNDLKTQGYQTVPAGNAPSQRTGTGVQCKDGYEKEAQALANTLQGLGVPSTVEAVSNPLPAGFDVSANCYVLLGE